MTSTFTSGRIIMMQYSTITNAIAFSVAPDENSPSQDTDFVVNQNMFNIADFMENAMRNSYTVMIQHEAGKTEALGIMSIA